MTTTPSRTPAGVPTGGQFAASAREESAMSLSAPAEPINPYGTCTSCGGEIPGRVGGHSEDGRNVDQYLPGTTCPTCGDTPADTFREVTSGEPGYYLRTYLRADGTIVRDRVIVDGVQSGGVQMFMPGDPGYEQAAHDFGTSPEALRAALDSVIDSRYDEDGIVIAPRRPATAIPLDESEVGMLVEQNRRDREASDRFHRYPESVARGRARHMSADEHEQNMGRPPAGFDSFNPHG